MTTTWTEAERATLAGIGDLLIPEADGMPSASQAGVGTEGIDEIARIRPDLLVTGRLACVQLKHAMPTSIPDLRAAIPEHFAAVAELVASAYFLRPRVAELLGYRARKAIPLDDEYLREMELRQLVAPVAERGNVWRCTPS